MRGSRCFLLVAAALTLGGCGDPSGPGLPGEISVCETNTGTVCGTWTRSGAGYAAQWSQGSVANITVEAFSSEYVHFSRVDHAGTSAGMTATYTGIVNGNGVQGGLVTWTHQGFTFSGTWSASW